MLLHYFDDLFIEVFSAKNHQKTQNPLGPGVFWKNWFTQFLQNTPGPKGFLDDCFQFAEKKGM